MGVDSTPRPELVAEPKEAEEAPLLTLGDGCNQVLLADGSGGDALVEFDLPAVSDLYFSADLYLSVALLASVDDLGNGPVALEVLAADDSVVESLATAQVPTGAAIDSSGAPVLSASPSGSTLGWQAADGTVFGTLASGWHHVQLRVNGTAHAFVIDGVLVYAYTGSGSEPAKLRAGVVGSTADPRQIHWIDNLEISTAPGAGDVFAEDFEGATPLADFSSSSGAVSVLDDPTCDAPDVVVAPASGHRYRWRFAVADLGLATKTILDGLATSRKITYTFNKAAVAVGTVPADSPEVNIEEGGSPFLEEGIRVLLAFRLEAPSLWVIRFAGIIMQLEDNVAEGQGSAPYTNFTAYDPWQYLYARPVRTAGGGLVGPTGLVFKATPANQVVTDLLARTQDPGNDGNAFIDASAGTIETCDPIDITFQQGTTVGEAWDQLCQSGFVDIILTPIYDPKGNPDKIAALNVYASPRDRIRRKAIFAWDKPSRSLTALNRLQDGTQRANRIQYYAGQGGPGGGVVSDGTSQAKYGDYWAEQFFPEQSTPAAVEALADEQLIVRKNGTVTYRADPTPGSLGQIDAPILFFDYFLGDLVPIYASSRFRKAVDTLQRVYQIPVEIRDDGVEQIAQLTFSADGLGD